MKYNEVKRAEGHKDRWPYREATAETIVNPRPVGKPCKINNRTKLKALGGLKGNKNLKKNTRKFSQSVQINITW